MCGCLSIFETWSRVAPISSGAARSIRTPPPPTKGASTACTDGPGRGDDYRDQSRSSEGLQMYVRCCFWTRPVSPSSDGETVRSEMWTLGLSFGLRAIERLDKWAEMSLYFLPFFTRDVVGCLGCLPPPPRSIPPSPRLRYASGG